MCVLSRAVCRVPSGVGGAGEAMGVWRHEAGVPNPSPSPGLVQRCVIIQKDDNGFGLTVSGDNPVFVQLVKEGKCCPAHGTEVPRQLARVCGWLCLLLCKAIM